MSALVAAVPQRVNIVKKLIEEAKKDKEAIEAALFKKAMEVRDPKVGEFLYIVASTLRKTGIRPMPRGILAAGSDGYIYVGPDYLKLKKAYDNRVVLFAWMHEAMHIIYGHVERIKLVRNPELYNIVADLYVNERLRYYLKDIPDDFVTLSSFITIVLSELGTNLPTESREKLHKLAVKVVNNEVTVEQVYKVIEPMPKVVKMFMKYFKNSRFFGQDLPKQRASSRGGGRDTEEGSERSSEKPGEETRGASKGTREATGAGAEGADREDRAAEKGAREGSGESGVKRSEGDEERERGAGAAEGDEKPEEEREARRAGEGARDEDRERQSKQREEASDTGQREERKEKQEGGGQQESWLDSKALEKLLDEIRKRLAERLADISRARGEYYAMRRKAETYTSAGTEPGTEPGIAGEVEMEEVRNLTRDLRRELVAEIGRVARDWTASFARFSDEAYWLPDEEEEPKPYVYVFVDVSPSIPEPVKKLFLGWVHEAAKKYKLEVTTVSFAVGVLDKKRGVPKKTVEGLGTVWDKSVAETIMEAIRRDAELIIVLSDFEILYSRDAIEAIKKFKKSGGRISCWSISGDFGSYCTTRHKLPFALSLIPGR